MKRTSFIIIIFAILSVTLTAQSNYKEWSNKQDSILTQEYIQELIRTEERIKARKLKIALTPAGSYLIKSRNHFLISIGSAVAGTTTMLIAPKIQYENGINLNYIGYGLIGMSAVFTITAIIHIGNAGISLNENGIGVKINLN